jgi:hypothetical protein
MRCFRCQKFGHTQQRCASNLVCAHCCENGHGDEPCPNPSHCVNSSRAHASGDRKCPIYQDEKCIQELRAKEGLSFLDARKKYMGSKPKTGSYSYATVLRRAQGTNAATQTTSAPNKVQQHLTDQYPPSLRCPHRLEDSHPLICVIRILMWVNNLRMMSHTDTVCQGPGHVLGHAKYSVDRLPDLIAVSQLQAHLTHRRSPKGKHRGRRKRCPFKPFLIF